MGTIKKIDEEYYIEFYARGLLYQQKAGKDLKAAEELLAATENKIKQGEMGIMVRNIDTDVFFETFIEQNQDKHFPRTWQRYLATIQHFEEFLKKSFKQSLKISDLTPNVIEQYRSFLLMQDPAKCGVNPRNKEKAINLTLYLLRDVLNFAISLGYIHDNPTLHARFLPVAKDDFIPEADLGKNFRYTTEREQLILKFLMATGLGFSTAAQLKWEDIDLQNRSIRVVSYGVKRSFPIDAEILGLLNKLQASSGREKFVLAGQLNERFLANIDRTAMRKVFIMRMAEKNIDLINIYKLLGLNDVAKILKYEFLIRKSKIN